MTITTKFVVTAVTTKLVVTAVMTKLVLTAVTTKLVVAAITMKLVVSAYFYKSCDLSRWSVKLVCIAGPASVANCKCCSTMRAILYAKCN